MRVVVVHHNGLMPWVLCWGCPFTLAPAAELVVALRVLASETVLARGEPAVSLAVAAGPLD